MSYEELLKCDGREFECQIDGCECKGKITVEDERVFLCQDLRDGTACEDKKGFKYSWFYQNEIGQVTSVSEFRLVTYPKVMMVSNSGVDWYKRVVFMEKCGKFLAWDCAETIEAAERYFIVRTWYYAKEVESEREREIRKLREDIKEIEERLRELEKRSDGNK